MNKLLPDNWKPEEVLCDVCGIRQSDKSFIDESDGIYKEPLIEGYAKRGIEICYLCLYQHMLTTNNDTERLRIHIINYHPNISLNNAIPVRIQDIISLPVSRNSKEEEINQFYLIRKSYYNINTGDNSNE